MKTFVTHINIIISAIKTVLSKWTYRVAFITLTISFVALYISIPIITIPGNTLAFQLGLYTNIDYAIFIFISVLTSLLVLMQVFSFHRSRMQNVRTNGIKHGNIGIFSGIFSGIFAGITCVPCTIGFLGIFGSAGSALIVSKYQYYFIAGAIMLVLWGMYHASRRVMGYCKECDISRP